MPTSLGGLWLLPLASCRKCAGVTSYIEGHVAYRIFNEFRLTTGLQSARSRRRKTKRPTHLLMRVDFGDRVEELEAPLSEHQSTLFLPLFPPPAIFLNQKPRENWDWVELCGWTQKDNRPWLRMPGVKGVIPKPEFSVRVFARFLAKIAHSFACAIVDPATFDNFLPDLILGTRSHLPYVIGSEPILPPPIDFFDHHHIRLRLIRHFGRTLLCARIRMFCGIGADISGSDGTPHYWVVVGEGKEQTLVAQLREHPRDA